MKITAKLQTQSRDPKKKNVGLIGKGKPVTGVGHTKGTYVLFAGAKTTEDIIIKGIET